MRTHILKEKLILLAVANYLDYRINRAEEARCGLISFTHSDLRSLERMIRSTWVELDGKSKTPGGHG